MTPAKTRAVEVAYVGCVVPDEAEYRNEAFSRAGNMFQTHLIAGLKAAHKTPSLVLGVRPMPAFPGCETLLMRSSKAILPCGVPVRLVACINITPIKQIMAGIATLYRLLQWGWTHRHAAARVVYTFNLSVPPGILTLLAARLIRASAIVSVNDINVPGETVPRTLFWKLDFWMHKRLIPRFDGLVVVSSAIVDDLAPATPFIRVEGGVSPEMALAADIHRNPNTGCFRIGFAGGLEAANGVTEMLRASELLTGSHYRFLLAGTGPLSEEVRCAAARDPRIEYRGFLPLEEVLSLYREVDVLVNMRLTKSLRTKYFFPSKLFELLASGTAVISTCTGHVEEEFGEFVFLLKDESAEGLAEAIRKAERAGERRRKEMAEQARECMLATKTWSIQTRRIANFIDTVCGCR